MKIPLTTLVAVYGAVLSTYLAVRAWWLDRPHVRVRYDFGVVPMDGMLKPVMLFWYYNAGKQPVQITKFGHVGTMGTMRKRRWPHWPQVGRMYPRMDGKGCGSDPPLPRVVGAGEGGHVWVDTDLLNGWHVNVEHIGFEDVGGSWHFCRPHLLREPFRRWRATHFPREDGS